MTSSAAPDLRAIGHTRCGASTRYEPQRAIRTKRFEYIRRFGERELPVLPNVDDGPTKDLLIAHGWAERPLPREELHDQISPADHPVAHR